MNQANKGDTISVPVAGRRRVAAGLLAIAGGSVLTSGMAAGVAASVPVDPDADLLALRPELDAAVADAGHWNTMEGWSDDELTRSGARLIDACWAIIDEPIAQTPAGRALKAAAAMHQLRFSCGPGGWGGDGEEMAWTVLSELAGSAYAPVAVPAYCADEQPERV